MEFSVWLCVFQSDYGINPKRVKSCQKFINHQEVMKKQLLRLLDRARSQKLDWSQWWNIKILKRNLKNSAKNKKWNYSSLWVSLRHTKPDETGKLSSMCHSMCHSMRLTKAHEEGYCESHCEKIMRKLWVEMNTLIMFNWLRWMTYRHLMILIKGHTE